MGTRSLYLRIACGAKSSFGVARFTSHAGQVWSLESVVATAPPPPGSPTTDREVVVGQFAVHAEFAGCPHCGARSCIKCVRCEKVSCWNEDLRRSECGWCGVVLPVADAITSLGRAD